MQTIATILGSLFLLWPILVIVGLIKPAWLKQPHRKAVLVKGVLIWLGVLIALIVVIPVPPEVRAKREAAAAQAQAQAEIAKAEAEATKAKAEAEAKCKEDLACWGNDHNMAATIVCRRPVERLACYAHKWTDGWLEPKFGHFRWRDQAQGIVTYTGDAIQFQNGFGAWENHVYECDYDPASESVLEVRASPGRL